VLFCVSSRQNQKDDGDRFKDVADTQAKVPWLRQLKSSLWHVCGPANIVAVVFLRYFFSFLMPPSRLVPTLPMFLIQFVLLALLADLGLYWFVHVKSCFVYLLSKFASGVIGFSMRTSGCGATVIRIIIAFAPPQRRARRTLKIATLSYRYEQNKWNFQNEFCFEIQAILPLLLAAVIVRPHPISYSVYVFFHLSNNTWNHSGLDGTLIRILSLKVSQHLYIYIYIYFFVIALSTVFAVSLCKYSSRRSSSLFWLSHG
jgi:hypothetical protein